MTNKKSWLDGEEWMQEKLKEKDLVTDEGFMFHKESKLKSTNDTEKVGVQDIKEENLAPCSKCFVNAHVKYQEKLFR